MVYTFPDVAQLNQFAAARLVTLAQAAVAGRNRFLLALSGGNTPLGLYELLAQLPYVEQIPWSHTHVLWADERCVPPDDDGSNYRAARLALLDHVPLAPAHIHRVPGELKPEKAADAYAQTLRGLAEVGMAWPRIDVVLLGMGRDGHTASLFPGTVSRLEQTQPTLAVSADYNGRPTARVTLTPRLLNDAQHVIFLVTGADKAEPLAQVLEGPPRPKELPAQRIRPKYGTLTWLVDAAAAARLTRR